MSIQMQMHKSASRLIIGIDPSSTSTGVGIIERSDNKLKIVHQQLIDTSSSTTLTEKLRELYTRLDRILVEFKPNQAAIEQLFLAQNVRSALILGQARGAALCCLAMHRLAIFEYSAKQAKIALTGYGNADKQQIIKMVRLIFKIDYKLNSDIADAIALAYCHMNQTNASIDRG